MCAAAAAAAAAGNILKKKFIYDTGAAFSSKTIQLAYICMRCARSFLLSS
jgi:hypothetical protein